MSSQLDLESLGQSDILDALPDGAYITDLNRHIVFWNAAAQRITGWKSIDVVGRRCADNILVHVDKDGHPLCGKEYCPLHRSMETGHSSAEAQLIFARSKSGSRVPVEVTVAPLRNDTGDVVGGIEVFRDMSATIDDLNRARIIQGSSVESHLPSDDRIEIATRYTPHDLVGGDFMHAERIDSDRYAILVADVMGHGMAAALYTMQLRSLWEENHSLLADPAEFLGALNSCLLVLTEGHDHFATAVHLVVNAATGAAEYAVAGHEHPLPAAEQEREKRGPFLGIIPDAGYAGVKTQLKHGDHRLLFTDGAIEVTNSEGEELGRAGLEKMMTECSDGEPAETLERIEEKLVRFNNNIRIGDDLTLVLIRRR